MRTLLLVAVGGAAGALLRHGAGVLAVRLGWAALPWATLAVNVLGCFALGALVAASERADLGPAWRPLVATGLLGALTTFSTFSVETLALAQRGSWGVAGANVLANVGLGLLAAGIGMAGARWALG